MAHKKPQTHEELKQFVFKLLHHKPHKVGELIKETQASRRDIRSVLEEFQAEGMNIQLRGKGQEVVYLNMTAIPQTSVKHMEYPDNHIIGVIADTHLCSEAARIDKLSEYMRIAKAEGVTSIFHAGDITDGFAVYPGHQNYITCWGTDAQATYCIEHYPALEDMVTYFITGNHDLKAMQSTGVDIGNLITASRHDLQYIGQYYKRVQLTESGLLMDLLHPSSGVAYAKSYHPQRYVQNIEGGDKPHILVWGHQHDSLYCETRNVHILKAGTFQGSTEYSRRKGFETSIGGWIVEYKMQDAIIHSVKMRWVRFY